MCQYGHGVVRDIFSQQRAANLRGFVGFLPMLKGDDAAAAYRQSQLTRDERITQVWDPTAQLGALLQLTLGLTDTAWDVYLVYPPQAIWEDAAPPPPSFWMHQLREKHGVGSAPFLDADELHAEVKRHLRRAEPSA